MHTINAVIEPGVAAPAVEAAPSRVRWSPVTRLAFRFFALYLTFYILTTQMYGGLVRLPWGRIPSIAESSMFQSAVTWVATRVLGFGEPLVRLSGSGDKPYDWAHAVMLLSISAVLTLLWTGLDRRRPGYPGLHKWFQLFLRFGVGATMLSYGTVKVFPLQMGYPVLTRLLEPYGHFSLMGVLWAQVGASPAYQRFTGIVEVSAAVLLLIPGLTTIGAVVSLLASSMIFVLNMTYDVPVKLFSLHLVVMSLVLLAPDMKRLLNVMVLNRPSGLSPVPPLFRGITARSIAVVVQLVVGGWLLWASFASASTGYRMSGPHAPKPPMYGIWNIETMEIDGQVRAALVTDYDRFRRVVIQRATGLTFQRMDDTFLHYGAKVDNGAQAIALTRIPQYHGQQVTPGPAGQLTFAQPAADRLLLAGEVEGRKLRMELRYSDPRNFRLVQNGFHWVQDYPVNR